VTIALITTKELVLKDFALESDEKKFIVGAKLIIENLAGNLALVTSRDPLKLSFQQTLKQYLDDFKIDDSIKENIIHHASVDNLDLGCALIKKAVIEKAMEDVQQDPVLIEAVEKRRQAREKGVVYYDDSALKICQNLPE